MRQVERPFIILCFHLSLFRFTRTLLNFIMGTFLTMILRVIDLCAENKSTHAHNEFVSMRERNIR
jgi:hypothetical protein